MKRLFPAAVIAVGIHGLLLAMNPPWNGTPGRREAPEPVTLELRMISRPSQAPSAVPEVLPEPPREEPPDQAAPEKPEPEARPEPLPDPEPEPDPAPEPPVKPSPAPEMKPDPLPEPAPEKPVKPAAAPPETREPRAPEKVKTDIPPSDSSRTKEIEAPAETGRREPDRITSPSPIPEPSAPAVREATPRYLENDPPEYPRIARRRGYSGTVVLEVLVSGQGRAEEVKVISSSGHRMLDESAIAAVAAWRFEPGTINGSPVSMRVKVPVRFTLK